MGVPNPLCVRHWVLTNIKTHEKKTLPVSDCYELEFSPDGRNAMIMGVTSAGDDFTQSDAEVLSKFVHRIGEHEFLFDMATGKIATWRRPWRETGLER